jgi:sulfotransferase family protein
VPLPNRSGRVRKQLLDVGLPIVRRLTHTAGATTASWRALPDFLIVGTMRGGTTSLYRSLTQHSRVMGALLDKEVHYFDLNATRGVDWYRARFPLRAAVRVRAQLSHGPVLVGEATPYYMFHPGVPTRASSVLPGLRAIAILRDPVDRAWSHYRLEVGLGHERLAFMDALDAESERLRNEAVRLAADPAAVSFSHQHHSYVARGHYIEQVSRWQTALGQDHVLVLTSEELFTRPTQAFERVLDFLGLPFEPPRHWRVRNAATPRPLEAAHRQRLRAEFRPDRQELRALLGSDPPWPD